MRQSPSPPVPTALACLLAAGSGLLYCFAEPGWGVWPLAALCLSPLVASLCGRSALARAGIGWIMGTVGAAATIGPVLFAAATRFFEFGTVASVGLAALVGQLFGGLPVALFALLSGDPLRHGAPSAVLRIAASWVASEWIRSVAWTGLPWTFLSHALAPAPALIQSASIGGAFFVSLWLAALNAALALAVLQHRRRAALWTLAGVAAAVGVHAASRLSSPPDASDALRVRLVQGNIPADWRGSVSGARSALGRLVDLTISGGDPVDLVVWPENAVGYLLPVNELPLNRETARLGDVTRHLLLGAPRVDDSQPTRFRNSALLMKPGEGALAFHDKVHLVPFAEYVPWPADVLGYEGPSYLAGARPTILPAGSTRLGALLCYEVIFPGIARALVLDGAQVLVNLSNDFWLGGPAGSEQHFAAAVFRAVEFGRPVLRATNTGITGAIDARGRVLARLEQDRAASLTVEIRPSDEATVYAGVRDAVAWLAVLWAVACTLLEAARGKALGAPIGWGNSRAKVRDIPRS